MTDRTSQANFLQSLFRIDPTQGFVEYIQATKPYHTKILDVLVEYVYAEDVNVTIADRLSWVMEFRRPDIDVVYTCGYGLVWDPVLSVTTPDAPLTPLLILEATDAIEVPNPGYENSNSFLIQSASFTSFVVAVASTTSNQFVFSKNYDVSNVNALASEWDITDPANELTSELALGDVFFISSDTGPVGNGRYTVASISHAAGVTTIETNEAIPVQANGDGVLHRPLTINEVPAWPAGQAVTLSATGTLPTPIVAGTRYYFQPSPNVGYFNLTTKRYPTQFSHFVNVSDVGFGEFSVVRDESLIPGAQITVSNSHYHRNDGVYIVKDIVPEGADERVFVYQKVESATPPAFLGGDGVINRNSQGFDEPIYCPPSQMSDLHADTFIHESLKFTFEINLADMMEATYSENQARGFGETLYGDAILGAYGTYADNFYSRTAQTSGLPPGSTLSGGKHNAHTILPTGIDTQLFDVGGFDETLHTVQHFYGRNIP